VAAWYILICAVDSQVETCRNVPWYEHDTGRAQHIHLGLNQLTIEDEAAIIFSV